LCAGDYRPERERAHSISQARQRILAFPSLRKGLDFVRIAYMLTSLGIGGAERQALSIAERMENRGHEIVLIVLRPRETREWPTQMRVERLGMTRSPVALANGVIRARRILRDFMPDIVHSHTCPANIAARLLRGRGTTPAVLSTIHNVYEGGWHRTLAYRMTDRFATHTTAVSQAVADRYISSGAVPADKCSILTNGIDVREFAPQSEKVRCNSVLPDTDGDFVWVSAGRDVPAKDFDTLLAAFALVRAELPQTQLWIAGQPGPRRMSEGQNDITERVRWLGIRNDMPDVLSACDGFVLSSAWEGMPLVVGEAMAMEKPVVATDVGGVRELLGDTGALVAAGSSQQLAAAMLRVMRVSEMKRRNWGRAGRERVCQSFDIDRKADEWEALFARVLRDGRPRR
jgi:glycosyltransferase involved in cell wall biosynthesis